MKRLIDFYLNEWAKSSFRKSLVLHGARQVGKTYAVRQLGSKFDNFIEVNLESNQMLNVIFERDLDPRRILRDICTALNIKMPVKGKTLIFFDEIQVIPKAILALRYFYEEMPEIYVVAAGSLLGFAIQQVGMPVGRVQSLYMYPMSFMEYLAAFERNTLINEIINHDENNEMSPVVHNLIIELLAQYSAIGGMPQVVDVWCKTQNVRECVVIHQSIINSYRQDFYKYARDRQINHVRAIFDNIPLQLGRKFKYSEIEGGYRSRELSPALDLLCVAGVAQKILYTAGQGIPLGAQVHFDDFKTLLLDVGLSQAILGLQLGDWFLHSANSFINKGELIEALVGQEILAYTDPMYNSELYYWHRRKVGGEAEIDYLIQEKEHIIPIEVKSGKGSTLKSMHVFLEQHPDSPYGIKFSTQNYSVYQKIRSLPLYAISSIFMDHQRKAFEYICGNQTLTNL